MCSGLILALLSWALDFWWFGNSLTRLGSIISCVCGSWFSCFWSSIWPHAGASFLDFRQDLAFSKAFLPDRMRNDNCAISNVFMDILLLKVISYNLCNFCRYILFEMNYFPWIIDLCMLVISISTCHFLENWSIHPDWQCNFNNWYQETRSYGWKIQPKNREVMIERRNSFPSEFYKIFQNAIFQKD